MSVTVAINARAAARAEVGGVERWARELAGRLPALRPDRYRTVLPPGRLAHRVGHAWEQLALPVIAREQRLILSPANIAPVASLRNVVIIHDAAPLRGPEWYGTAYGTWHRTLAPLIVKRARLVIVPSTFVAHELAQLLPVAAGSLRVVPPGLSLRPLPAGRQEAPTTLRRLDLSRPYILAVGTDVARKNFALLDAIQPTLADAGLDVVIAGSNRGYMRGGGGGAARRLGYVADSDLPGLYGGAAAFAMPSLYEGFGLPCVEAMAAGAPVVCSDRSALPETCGGAATLVDPDDERAFAQALIDVARDGAVRDELVTAGYRRAEQFRWDRTASLVDDAISGALEQRPVTGSPPTGAG